MTSFRWAVCVVLGTLLGALWGMWVFGFALYMHAEDLYSESSPEAMALASGFPPQLTPIALTVVAGIVVCVVVLIASFLRGHATPRRGSVEGR